MAAKNETNDVKTLVIISDLHAGCRLGLCPPGPIPLDDGGTYRASKLQRGLWRMWRYFWDVWVPQVAHGEPFGVVVNGDALDGVHHGTTTQISHNLGDQARIAWMLLEPVLEQCGGRFRMIRGTEAHVGQSGVEEERLAESLGAIPDEQGRYARYELWLRVGKGLVHLLHHISPSGASHYESTAIMKELTESYAEAGRNRLEPPDVVVRSHRHREIEIRVPTKLGYGIAMCTAGWQLKTPFMYRIASARTTTPQIGGSCIRQGDEELYARHKHWSIRRPKEERL